MAHPKRLDQTTAKDCVTDFDLLSSPLFQRRILNSTIASLVVVAFLASDMVSAPSKAPTALPNRTSNTLSNLQFKNSGTVRSGMRFEYFNQPVSYAEGISHWNVQRDMEYLYLVEGGKRIDPPTGMRSAVPLGGLGSGTVELRADGGLRDWNIYNNSPAGGLKIQIEDTFFGLWVRQENLPPKSWTLRTHPSKGLPPIAEIEYSGAFPVSRLRFADSDLPIAVELFAYSEFHPRDPKASASPAAIFTFDLHNPSREAVEVGLLFNVRNYTKGHATSHGQLIFQKHGKEPTSGSVAAQVAGEGISITSATSSNLLTLWSGFARTGDLQGRKALRKVPKFGALVAKTTLGPGSSKTITFVLAWYLPYRPYKGQVPGNYYTTLYRNAHDVASRVLGRLDATWEAIRCWQGTIFDNTLPDWLQDSLINSVATMYKTGLWFSDGSWRQWESFSCSGLNPIHIDFYRILPYAFFFPSLQEQLLSTHAQAQLANGFIHEQLTTGCFAPDSELGQPGGREMGDSATDFILQTWQIYSWTGDRGYLDSIWPPVKKAAAWQLSRSEKYELPEHLNNTYDWWEFEKKDLVSYNAFLHLATLLAAEKLAQVEGEPELAQRYRKAYELGQKSLYDHFWTGEYFRSWWRDGKPYPDALHADTLYGQLWAFVLNLGLTVDEDKLKSHLQSESTVNGSPFGLKVMRRAEPEYPERENSVPPEGGLKAARDNLIWEAGSLDWCTLNLYLGGSLQQSMSEAEKVVGDWQHRLSDQWDYTDLTTAWDGYPWCNSHYTRQLILWAIPLALSGQHYFAPRESLSFDPRVAAPARLPFFTPTADGILQVLPGGLYRLTLESGKLKLRSLRVGNAYLERELSLGPGASVDLHAE